MIEILRYSPQGLMLGCMASESELEGFGLSGSFGAEG